MSVDQVWPGCWHRRDFGSTIACQTDFSVLVLLCMDGGVIIVSIGNALVGVLFNVALMRHIELFSSMSTNLVFLLDSQTGE